MNETRKQVIIKFVLLLGVLCAYFGYLSWKFDLATGGLVALLTWSFFVLCTPIADAGFLLDFPLRLIFGVRMLISEICVWIIAITSNLAALKWAPDAYEKTFLTSLFHKILVTPWPYWGIIGLAALGTFLSVHFGDELMDVVHHKDRKFHHKHGFKHELIIYAALFLLAFWGYYHLAESLGVAKALD